MNLEQSFHTFPRKISHSKADYSRNVCLNSAFYTQSSFNNNNNGNKNDESEIYNGHKNCCSVDSRPNCEKRRGKLPKIETCRFQPNQNFVDKEVYLDKGLNKQANGAVDANRKDSQTNFSCKNCKQSCNRPVLRDGHSAVVMVCCNNNNENGNENKSNNGECVHYEAEVCGFENTPQQNNNELQLIKCSSNVSSKEESNEENLSMISTLAEDVDELNDLPETNVDSEEEEEDDEDSCPSGESLMELKDAVRECLEKDPLERTEDDVHVLADFMQHMPAFANLPSCLKHELCRKLVFALVENACTVILHDGEQLDSWCVIVNGEIEVRFSDGSRQEYHLGDSFGIEPKPEVQFHRGEMRTLVDDCQFVLVTQKDYVEILSKLSSNLLQQKDASGEIISETERRISDNKEYYVLIKGKPERLLEALVNEKDISSDPFYVEDFLLMRRVFLPDSVKIFETFLRWFSEFYLKEKVARLVLLWVNNHFCDFESDSKMMHLLDHFGKQLEKEGMANHRQLLNIACSVKSRPRTLIYARSNREEILHFSILGGQDKSSYGIFVSQVEENSAAEKIGLKRGDQILEVNGNSFLRVSHQKALEILRGSTHLSIVVKSNLLGLKEMLENSCNSRFLPSNGFNGFSAPFPPPATISSQRHKSADLTNVPNLAVNIGSSNQQRYPAAGPAFLHHARSCSNAKTLRVTSLCPTPPKFNSKSPEKELINKIGRLLKKITYSGKEEDDNNNNHSKTLFKSSSPGNPALKHSRSNPDLSIHTVNGLSQYYQPVPAHCPEHVLKIYRSDQSYKYLSVYKETTAQNVVQLALQEFGMASGDASSLEWTLCEVSASNGAIRQKRLPNQMQNLAEKIALNSRYYLKNLRSSDPLVPDELISDLTKESLINFLHLNASGLAAQLTLQDFALFSSIQATDYVEDLFKLGPLGGPQSNGENGTIVSKLNQFEEVVNREMWWVVTEICREKNIFRRVKIIKKFIKVARRCRDFKNFNSMFAIMSGLEKPAVKRLHSSWDKISNKYQKIFNDLQLLLDPSRNMSKYRQHLHKTASESPPVIPLFPIVRKDLYFIHECNRTWCDGLVNFEKLRMISKEIRAITRLSSVPYDLSAMSVQSGHSKNLTGALLHMNSFERGASVATMRKNHVHKANSCSRKKLYEQALMVRRCKAYLQNMPVIDDEHELDRISFECEPHSHNGFTQNHPSRWPLGSRSVSSCGSSASLNSEKSRTICAFGVESPQAVQKMLALVDHSRIRSPIASRPNRNSAVVNSNGAPLSPVACRLHKFLYKNHLNGKDCQPEAVKPVDLTVESSSVTSFASFNGLGGVMSAYAADRDGSDSGRGSHDSNSTGSSQESPSLGHQKRFFGKHFNRLAKIPGHRAAVFSAVGPNFGSSRTFDRHKVPKSAESDDERNYLLNRENPYFDKRHLSNNRDPRIIQRKIGGGVVCRPASRVRRTNSNPSEKFGDARVLYYNAFYEEDPSSHFEQVSRV